MWVHFHAHHCYPIRFFFGQLVDFALELIGLFPVEPPGFAAAFRRDLAQAFKEQHTARVLLADLDNRSRRFVSSVQILPPDMGPQLLITPFSFDRTTCLPLLFGNAPQMLKACLIEPLI